MKSIRNSKGLYWGLIIAFFALYILVGFVSTLHSITFFELANTVWMAVLLGITYEIGQAAVLFSILMSDNSKKILPWLLMFLLTALQVTANVYASFKFMDSSGSNDWTFWQRSILFWLEADGPEMFKVVISWISGALLPVVALGMTALVAENLKLKDEREEKEEFKSKGFLEVPEEKVEVETPEDVIVDKEKEIDRRTAELEALRIQLLNNQEKWPVQGKAKVIEPDPVIPAPPGPLSKDVKEVFAKPKDIVKDIIESPMLKAGEKVEKTPELHPRGWHLKKEHIDSNGDFYSFGKYLPDGKLQPDVEVKIDPPKKAQG